MLIRHGVAYLLTRFGAGLINFITILLYTRLLTVEEYGRYALLIAGVGLVSGVSTVWLAEAALRFTNPQCVFPELICAIRRLQVYVLLSLTGLTISALPLVRSAEWQLLVGVGIGLLWLQSIYDIRLHLLRALLRPDVFALVVALRAMATLVVGWGAVSLGLGAFGAAIGHLMGLAVAILFPVPSLKGAGSVSAELVHKIWRYGAPLSVSYLLAHILHTSDRFFIAFFCGEGAAGAYAAVYDMTAQTLALFLLSAANASTPLIFKAASENADAKMRELLRENLALLLTIGVIGVVMWWKVAPTLIARFIGLGYQENLALLAPIIAAATLITDLRTHHFVIPLKIKQFTSALVVDTFVAALGNILLNLWLIPRIGILGAAIATLISYTISLIIATTLACRKAFVVVSWRDVACIFLCGVGAASCLTTLPSTTAGQALLNGLFGGIIYAAGILALNIAGWRDRLWRFLNEAMSVVK